MAEKLPKSVKDAAASDDPIQALTALRDKLAGAADVVQPTVLAQVASQLMACIKLLDEMKRGNRDGDGKPGAGADHGTGSDSGNAADRWARRVGSTNVPAAAS